MNNTIRIAKHTLPEFTEECNRMGISFLNLGDADGSTRIMLDTNDLLDAYSLGYIMGVSAMTDNIKSDLKKISGL